MTEIMLTETPIKKPHIPEEWDFGVADKDFDKHIHNWRRLTGDVISELWIFYNKLKVQGKRTDLSANAEKLPAWLEWLEAKGIGSDTPIRRFKALGWLPGKAHVSLATGENEWYTPPNPGEGGCCPMKYAFLA